MQGCSVPHPWNDARDYSAPDNNGFLNYNEAVLSANAATICCYYNTCKFENLKMLVPKVVARLALTRASTAACIQHAAFHCTPTLLSKALPPRPVLLESDLIENFLKGSGPGGQKINKTSSAVQLKHIPTGIVVKYQDTRSREINRKMARRILQDRIEELELGDEARTRVKAREKSMKKARAGKKSRRKYRALEEAKRSASENLSADEDVVLEEAEEQSAVPDSARAGGPSKVEGG